MTKKCPQHYLVTELQLEVGRRLGRGDGGEGELKAATDQVMVMAMMVMMVTMIMIMNHDGGYYN